MGQGAFVKVFDVADSGFRDWDFAAFGLIFVGVGLVIFFGPRVIRALGIPFRDFRSWSYNLFRYFFLGFSLFWVTVAFAGTYGVYLHHRALLRDGGYRTAEGTVEDFVPMPFEGHADESFTVSGVDFSYSDYGVTDAFNNSQSHGGPIRAGQYVRIAYDPANHAILRLEIRGYRGAIPDYGHQSALTDMVEKPPPLPEKDVPPEPWYAGLFVWLYFLDFIGLFLMVRPYLRTFFPIADLAGSGRLRALEDRMKLTDTLLVRDGPRHFWLRARGFNIFRVPLVVAHVEVADDMSVVRSRIRFSSGYPFVLLAFGFGVSTVLTAAPPLRDAGPYFLGAFAVLIAIGSFVMLRRLRQRMEILLAEALEELRLS
jgi:hypothetical protein